MSKVSEYPGLAERIYDLRRQAGWSRASLSRKMNELGHVHWQQGTVANIENGIRYLRLYEGFAMAKIFLVDIYELAYGLQWRSCGSSGRWPTRGYWSWTRCSVPTTRRCDGMDEQAGPLGLDRDRRRSPGRHPGSSDRECVPDPGLLPLRST